MTNQQLLNYIKQRLQQGVNKGDIKNSLIANGWQASNIEEAFNSITAPNQFNNSPQSSKSKVLFITIAIIIGALVIGGGVAGYFVLVRNSPTLPAAQKPLEQVSPQETPKQTSTQPTQQQTTPKPVEEPKVSLDGWVEYIDPQNRFSFSYPPTFGTPSQGTNDGFGDRVAAVRFSEFSSGIQNGKIILGGEVVLTKGFVLVDIQALGGLYDSITLEVFPDTLRNNILSNLPTLTTTNFCGELAKEHHIDINKSAFASLNQQQRNAIVEMDQTRNIEPKVIRCDVVGDTVIFQKEATFESGQVKSRQNVYGAIRFLKSPLSSFQIIRATVEAPTQEMLSNITSIVESFK